MSQQQPSLDMRHGFMKSIIKNQIERDNYHKEVEERKEQEREQRRNKSVNKNKRPEQARYLPPVRSREVRETALIFKLEYEDEWGRIHELPIKRTDDPYDLAEKFGREQKMDDAMIDCLARKLEKEIQIRI